MCLNKNSAIAIIMNVSNTFRYDVWTHQPGSHRRNVALEFVCFFLHRPSAGACLHFLSRERISRPFPSLTVKSNFVYPRHNRSPLVGHDVIKNPSSCDRAEIRFHVLHNVRRFRSYQLNHRGDRFRVPIITPITATFRTGTRSTGFVNRKFATLYRSCKKIESSQASLVALVSHRYNQS